MRKCGGWVVLAGLSSGLKGGICGICHRRGRKTFSVISFSVVFFGALRPLASAEGRKPEIRSGSVILARESIKNFYSFVAIYDKGWSR